MTSSNFQEELYEKNLLSHDKFQIEIRGVQIEPHL